MFGAQIVIVKKRPNRGDGTSIIRDVAQLVAHLIWDEGVVGSSPAIPTVSDQIVSRKERNGARSVSSQLGVEKLTARGRRSHQLRNCLFVRGWKRP